MENKKKSDSGRVQVNISDSHGSNNSKIGDSFYSQADQISKMIYDSDFLLNQGNDKMNLASLNKNNFAAMDNLAAPVVDEANNKKSNQVALLNDGTGDSSINDLQLMLPIQSASLSNPMNNINASLFEDYLLNDINSELKYSDLVKNKKDEKSKKNNISRVSDSNKQTQDRLIDSDNDVADGNNNDNDIINAMLKPSSKRQTGVTPTTTHHKSRPIFVMKIWLMMNEPSNNKFIQWANDGKSFKVLNRLLFMKNVLPKYFKHSNFSSFVRQLNMYGWHKVQEVNHKQDSDSSGDEVWQFQNLYFQKGREDLLDNIVRHKSGKQAKEEDELDVNLVVNELNKIKTNQAIIADDLKRVRSDNSLLWQEIFTTRERYSKQNETLNTILRFIASVFQNNSNFNHRDIAFDGNASSALMNALFESANNAATTTGTVNNQGSSNPNGMMYSSPPSDFKYSHPTVAQSTRPRLMLMGSNSNESGNINTNSIPSPASIYTLPESNLSKRNSISNKNIYEIGKSVTSENPGHLSVLNDSIGDEGSSRVKEITESDKTSSPSDIVQSNQVTPSSNTINDIQNNLSKQDQSLNALSELLNKYLPSYDTNSNGNEINNSSESMSKLSPSNFTIDDLLNSKINNLNPLLVDDIPEIITLPNGSETANREYADNKRKAFEMNDEEMNEILSKKPKN